jgi:hypothetical protein
MERQIFAGHGVDIIDGPIMLIIELCIRSSARDTFLTFLIVRVLPGRATLGGVTKRNSVAIQGFASTIYRYISVEKALINVDKLLVGEKKLKPSAVATVRCFSSRFNEGP